MCSECLQTKHLPGCPNEPFPETMGWCLCCGEELTDNFDYVTDNDGNLFCSEKCAIENYGINTNSWSED